jgi:hypothetical protein
MLGHSVGEYVAACLAGVFSFEDGLALVAERGRLMGELPAGGMLAVPLDEAETRARLDDGLALAAVNGAAGCVASGETAAVEALRVRLLAEGIEGRRLRVSHAFHSPMMDPILDRFAAAVSRVERHPPILPWVSNVSGSWILPEEAVDPRYWARHLRATVRFEDGVGALLAGAGRILLEVGPGETLSRFARRDPAAHGRAVLASLPESGGEGSGERALLEALGGLWAAGARPDWRGFHAGERRRRVPLPTYPFERQRCWIERQEAAAPEGLALAPARRRGIWRPEGATWWIRGEGGGVRVALAGRLREAGERVLPAAGPESAPPAGEAAELRVVWLDALDGGSDPAGAVRALLRLAASLVGRPSRLLVPLRGGDPLAVGALPALCRTLVLPGVALRAIDLGMADPASAAGLLLDEMAALAGLPAAEPVGEAASSAPEETGEPAPGDEIEATIAGIWRELFGLARIGAHDSFFALGGDSLLATRIVARMRAALGREVTLSSFLEAGTIARLAEVCRALPGALPSAALLADLESLSADELAELLASGASGCDERGMPGQG